MQILCFVKKNRQYKKLSKKTLSLQEKYAACNWKIHIGRPGI